MDTIWLGVKLAVGLAIGAAIVSIVVVAARRISASLLTRRFIRAGCVYQPSETPGAPSGWLIRDIRNVDFLLWDERKGAALRVRDDAPTAETWHSSPETLNEFLLLAQEEQSFWSEAAETANTPSEDR